MTVMNLDKLDVWVRAKDFAVAVYKEVVPHLPADEKWNLAQQLKRAAQSIPANIAEGYGRFYFQESVRFCYIARGSLEETFSHLTLAHKLDYLNDETYKQLNDQIIELRRMINGYIAFLKESKRGASEPGANHHVREDAPDYSANFIDLESPKP